MKHHKTRVDSDSISASTTHSPPSITIVVPTFKEAANIKELANRIQDTFKSFDRRYEILIVDDDSSDGINDICDSLKKQNHPIKLIIRTDQKGLSSAVLRGFEEASGSIFVCLDGDLSHQPEEIPNLITPIEDGRSDFVIGSRYVQEGTVNEEWGWLRKLNSWMAILLARPFTSLRDPTSGFFAITRSRFEQSSPLRPTGYKIGLELIVKSGKKDPLEVPIQFQNRKRGSSKLTLEQRMRYLQHIKRLSDYEYGSLSRYLQFISVGASGMILDLSSFSILSLLLDVSAGISRASAIGIAMTWNFLLNRRITFRDSPDHSSARQYLKFCISSGAGGIVNWLVSMGSISMLPVTVPGKLGGAFLGILTGSIFTFLLSRYWVFQLPEST